MTSREVWNGESKPYDLVPTDRLADSLANLVAVCDAWLESHSQNFDPFDWHSLEERYARRKAFAEASIYLYVATKVGGTNPAPRLRQLVLDVSADPRYAALVRRNPRQFGLYAAPAIYAQAEGLLSPRLGEAVNAVLRSRAMWATERLPHRDMDLWNFCQAFGYDDHHLDVEEVLKRSCLANPPDSVDCSLRDAYALTHNYLFFYNFGVPHPRFPQERAPSEPGELLEALILRFMAEGNADIVLELVMAGDLHRALQADIATNVVSWCAGLVDSWGHLPGPSRSDGTRRVSGDTNFDSWENHYHTNLVGASAFRLLSRDLSVIGPSYGLDPLETHRLGLTLSSFAAYELPMGAARLQSLLGGPAADRFRPIVQEMVAYVTTQYDEGTSRFGFWTDEEHAYATIDGAGSFDNEVAAPVKDICRDLLDAAALSQAATD